VRVDFSGDEEEADDVGADFLRSSLEGDVFDLARRNLHRLPARTT